MGFVDNRPTEEEKPTTYKGVDIPDSPTQLSAWAPTGPRSGADGAGLKDSRDAGIDVEAVIFIGIQATGKSSFYAERFLNTHLRLNMDMLKTRHRESILLAAFIEGKVPFVSDNTNPTRDERQRYISPAKKAGFRVIGYYFSSSLSDAMRRNAEREGKSRVPDAGVRGTYSRLELPDGSEGFDELHYVKLDATGGFAVEEWKDEV